MKIRYKGANVHTKMISFNIFNQLKHIPLKTLVAQWVHPFTWKRFPALVQISSTLEMEKYENRILVFNSLYSGITYKCDRQITVVVQSLIVSNVQCHYDRTFRYIRYMYVTCEFMSTFSLFNSIWID